MALSAECSRFAAEARRRTAALVCANKIPCARHYAELDAFDGRRLRICATHDASYTRIMMNHAYH